MTDEELNHGREVAYVANKICEAMVKDQNLTLMGNMTNAAVMVIAAVDAIVEYRRVRDNREQLTKDIGPGLKGLSGMALDVWSDLNEGLPKREPDEPDDAFRERLTKTSREAALR